MTRRPASRLLGNGPAIRRAAGAVFGGDVGPAAILLTHCHGQPLGGLSVAHDLRAFIDRLFASLESASR